jgi:hypothetical protein
MIINWASLALEFSTLDLIFSRSNKDRCEAFGLALSEEYEEGHYEVERQASTASFCFEE